MGGFCRGGQGGQGDVAEAGNGDVAFGAGPVRTRQGAERAPLPPRRLSSFIPPRILEGNDVMDFEDNTVGVEPTADEQCGLSGAPSNPSAPLCPDPGGVQGGRVPGRDRRRLHPERPRRVQGEHGQASSCQSRPSHGQHEGPRRLVTQAQIPDRVSAQSVPLTGIATSQRSGMLTGMVQREPTMADVASLDPDIPDCLPAQDLFVIQLRGFLHPRPLSEVLRQCRVHSQGSRGTVTGIWPPFQSQK